MPLDHYVTLGNSGLRVSPFCLGTMTFGLEWGGWGATPETSRDILAAYLARGGNFIDTANVYTNGHSEKIIGDYFAGGETRRHRAVIATKFFCNLYSGDPNGGGASRKAIIEQCEQSLRRLQTDYIDLYWCHNWDKFTPVEETMRTLDDLVTAGKIRYIGFSDAPAWKVAQAQTIAKFRGWAPLIALQVEYSLAQRTVEGELMPMAQELGLGVTPWGPLHNGALSGKYTRDNANTLQAARGAAVTALDERDYQMIDALLEIGETTATSAAAVALAWVQNRPGVTATIIGARTMAQLDGNLAGLAVQLTQDQIARLDALSEPQLNFPADFLKRMSSSLSHAGATVNGEPSNPRPFAPKNDAEVY